MDPGEGREFIGYPPPPPAKPTKGEARPREAEMEAAAGGQSRVNFSLTRDPEQDLYVQGVQG
jgi:hypothetical protein